MKAIEDSAMDRWLVIALATACLSGCVSVNRGSRPMGSIVGQMDQTPQPGDWCRITFPDDSTGWRNSSREMTGRVTDIDEEGIHLSDAVVMARETRATPVASQAPYVGRLFKNTGVGLEPAESDQIIRPDEFKRLEIITKEQAWQPNAQLLAQQLTKAVPMRRTP
jgi:hypothetical protein